MLNLPDVTLVCVDTINHALASMAVRACIRQARFAEVLLWSDQTLNVPGVATRPVHRLASVSDYDAFMWSEAWRAVPSSHFLIVQWDGWITEPECWDPDFLLCDYVGAPWWYRDGYNVGNSGFSLRSREMSQFLTEHVSEFPFAAPADAVLCRQYRPRLERYGFAWASEQLAHKFSFECTQPARTFGFHAFRNWPFVLDEFDLEFRLGLCREDQLQGEQYEWLDWNRRCRSTQPHAA